MTHYYRDGVLSKPGVTSIIADCHDKSGPLTQWAANMVVEWIKLNCVCKISSDDSMWYISESELNDARFHFKDISKEALDVGSEVHHSIETWLKTKKEPKDPCPEVLNGFVAFLEFYDSHKMKPLELEFSVLGDYWGGTLDYYGWFDDKLYVIDFKTSKDHRPKEHGPQIAAYRSRVNARVDGCGILRLDKTTGISDFKDYSRRYHKDLEHFLLMVPLYMHRHPKIAKNAGWIQPF